MSEPTLIASILCEDVLPSALIDGRPTLYRVVLDLSANLFPARVYRLFCVNIWRGGHGEFVGRVGVLTPLGQLAAEVESTFVARPEGHHIQIVRLDNLVLHQAGEYTVEIFRNARLVMGYTIPVNINRQDSGGV